jgi:putative tricarboxylic transport membrane protein
MRAADLVTATILMLLGVVVIIDAVRLGIGWGTDGPKSGFFPFWLGTLLVVTTALIIVHALRRRGAPAFVRREQLGSVLRVLAPATAFVVLTQLIGLYVSGALYIALSMRWMGRHRWLPTVSVAAGVVIVVFIVFERWFLVPMPKGPLEAWLGF